MEDYAKQTNQANPIPREPRRVKDPTEELITRRHVLHFYGDEDTDTAPAWLIKGVIPQGMAMLFGKTNIGKSFVALDLAIHVASGNPWHGRRTKQGTVVYLNSEGGRAFRLRSHTAARKLSVDSRVLPLVTIDGSVFAGVSESFLSELAKQIRDEVSKRGYLPVRLLIVDTVAANLDGDENSSETMMKFIRSLKAFALTLDKETSVLLVHHVGRNNQDRERGSSALPGDVDCILQLRTVSDSEPKHLGLLCPKQRDGEKEDTVIGLALVPAVVLKSDGSPLLDEDGDEVTTQVVEPRERGTTTAQRVRTPAEIGLERDVLAFVEKNPKASLRDVRENVEGGNKQIKKALDSLVRRGAIRKEHRRGKGGGFAYTVPKPPSPPTKLPADWFNHPEDYPELCEPFTVN